MIVVSFFFFKQKTAYEMLISDWSSDVCSSDLPFARVWGWRCVWGLPYRGTKSPLPELSHVLVCYSPCRAARRERRAGGLLRAHGPLRDPARRLDRDGRRRERRGRTDRKSTRLNSSH